MGQAVNSWITRRLHPDGVEACIQDSNISVWGLVEYRDMGLTDAEILGRVQGLSRDDLDCAWDYYESNRIEVDGFIHRNLAE